LRDPYWNINFLSISRGYEGHTLYAENLHHLLEEKNFDKEKVTAIYTYGFLETPFMPSVRAVLDAYLKDENHNFMIVHCDSIFLYNVFVS